MPSPPLTLPPTCQASSPPQLLHGNTTDPLLAPSAVRGALFGALFEALIGVSGWVSIHAFLHVFRH